MMHIVADFNPLPRKQADVVLITSCGALFESLLTDVPELDASGTHVAIKTERIGIRRFLCGVLCFFCIKVSR